MLVTLKVKGVRGESVNKGHTYSVYKSLPHGKLGLANLI